MGRPKKVDNANGSDASTRRVTRTTVERFNQAEGQETGEIIDLEQVNVDPLHEFLQQIDSSRELVMHIWVLPNYAKDGKLSTRAMDRAFLTSFAFGPDEVETYRETIQRAYPPGGAFNIELRENGQFVRKWSEQIMAAPGYAPPTTTTGQPINISLPGQPAPTVVAPTDPFDTIERQLGLTVRLAELAKTLNPPPATPPPSPDNGDVPIGERMLAAAIPTLVGRSDVKMESIIELLGGATSKPTGFWDFAESVAPHIGPGLNALLGAGANWLMQRIALNAQQAGQLPPPIPPQQVQVGPGTANPQPPTQMAPAAQPAAETPPQAQPDPFTVAYQSAIGKLVQDCGRQVQKGDWKPEDGPHVSPKPGAEIIWALTEEFPPGTAEHPTLQAIVGQFMQADPVDILKMCAGIAPTPAAQQFVVNLIAEPVALAWVGELQRELRDIVREAEVEEAEEL